MKRWLGRNIILVVAIATGFNAGIAFAATVHWSGTSVSNVVDDHLVIDNDVELPLGGTTIEAKNKDVLVDIKRTLTVSGNDSGRSRLYLHAHAGHNIRVKLDHKLHLTGSLSGTNDPLLIVQGGNGKVIWEIEGDDSLMLDSEDGRGGVEYYIFLKEGDEYNNGPEAIFQRISSRAHHAQENISIVLDGHSFLGYISHAGVGNDHRIGAFTFDPSNTGSGLMELKIKDHAGVIVSPRRSTKSNFTDVTLNDIKKDELAGGIATFRIINPLEDDATNANLFITNYNEHLSQFLFDPFLNLHVRKDHQDHRGSFDGKQWGFVVGSNGNFEILDDASVTYVGLAENDKPDLNHHIEGFEDVPTSSVVKKRNPSALTTDQSLDHLSNNPTFTFGSNAGLFFISGIDKKGHIRDLDESHPFTVKASRRIGPRQVGNYVLETEGDVDFIGLDEDKTAKIEVLSLEVDPFGGPLFVGGRGSLYPIRTFDTDDHDQFLTYNNAAFIINGKARFQNIRLVHTNENAQVFSQDDANSVPTYVGGDTFHILKRDTINADITTMSRPKIEFINSIFEIREDVAFTGLDIEIPDYVSGHAVQKNYSELVFGYNGLRVDHGTGRVMILGTLVGATASDGVTIVSSDAHLDIIQTKDATRIDVDPNDPQGNQTLDVLVTPNDDTINNEITGDITDQLSTHEIFLGQNSNISIGTNADSTGFMVDTNPEFRISGNFIAFESAGGVLRNPRLAGRTGQGGIFVDLNGKISVSDGFDAVFGVMVVKSRNAIIDLPPDRAHFQDDFGVTNWNLNFETTPEYENQLRINHTRLFDYEGVPPTELSNPIIVAANERFATFVLDFATIRTTPGDLTNVPTIEGEVDRLIITGTTFSNPGILRVNGGRVRELIFVDSGLSGEFPNLTVILSNGGTLELGEGVNLGEGGVIFIIEGENELVLSSNITISGIFPFTFGPEAEPGSTFIIRSETPVVITVQEGAVLDLSGADGGFVVNFAGDIEILMEPRASIEFGDAIRANPNAGILRLSDQAHIVFEPDLGFDEFFAGIPLGPIDTTPVTEPLTSVDAALPHNEFAPLINYGAGLHNTDDFRSRIFGIGVIELIDDSFISIPKNTIVGIETTADRPVTDITIDLKDSGALLVGNSEFEEGGILQIGNVEDMGPDHSITFTVILDGDNAKFVAGPQAMIGFNVGAVKASSEKPSDLLVDTMFNVTSNIININRGLVDFSRIFDTDSPLSNVILIGDNGDGTPVYSLIYQNVGSASAILDTANMHGGSPLVYIVRGDPVLDNLGAVSPIVRTDDDQIQVGTDVDGNPIFDERMRVGMVAATLLQDLTANLVDVDALTFFEAIKTQDALGNTPARSLANTGTAEEELSIRLGTMARDTLIRQDFETIFGAGGTPESNRQQALENGAVFVSIDPNTLVITSASQIPV